MDVRLTEQQLLSRIGLASSLVRDLCSRKDFAINYTFYLMDISSTTRHLCRVDLPLTSAELDHSWSLLNESGLGSTVEPLDRLKAQLPVINNLFTLLYSHPECAVEGPDGIPNDKHDEGNSVRHQNRL